MGLKFSFKHTKKGKKGGSPEVNRKNHQARDFGGKVIKRSPFFKERCRTWGQCLSMGGALWTVQYLGREIWRGEQESDEQMVGNNKWVVQ